MIQILLLAQSVDKPSVGFHVLVVPLDSVIEVGFDFEEQAEVGVGDVEGLVNLMLPGQDNFDVQRYWLRSETLCTCNAEPLARFIDGDVTTLYGSHESFIAELT